MELEPVSQAECLREVTVGCPKVADEAEDGVDVRTGEGLEDRPRAPAAEEAAGVRDPEAAATGCMRAPRSPRSRSRWRSSRPGPRRAHAAPRRSGRRRRRRRRPCVPRAARRSLPSAPWHARATLSVRRCGLATIESRRSAIQRASVARRTAAPTRWTDVGGEVVSTTSIFSRLTMRIAAGIAVRFQVTFSSGARALRKVRPALRAARSIPVTPCSSSAGRRPLGPR